jgi:SAM-dependent methyltransferase
MARPTAASWEMVPRAGRGSGQTVLVHRRFTAAAPAGRSLPTDTFTYGADIPGEPKLRLLGNVDGKRVLELGCGAGHNAVALARQGARVLAVDTSAEQIAEARFAADRAGVRLELHHAPLAELAFVRADSVDICVSAFGLAAVTDIDRVFRQVHRVLRPEGPLVISLPHPVFNLVDPKDAELRIRRSYWESAPVTTSGSDTTDGPDQPRNISQLFTSLGRANFRVDTILEPQPDPSGPRSDHWVDAMAQLPATLVIRARKEGI